MSELAVSSNTCKTSYTDLFPPLQFNPVSCDFSLYLLRKMMYQEVQFYSTSCFCSKNTAQRHLQWSVQNCLYHDLCCPRTNFKGTITRNAHTSIFTGEAYAIFLVASYNLPNDIHKSVIYTGSLGVVRASSFTKQSKTHLIKLLEPSFPLMPHTLGARELSYAWKWDGGSDGRTPLRSETVDIQQYPILPEATHQTTL